MKRHDQQDSAPAAGPRGPTRRAGLRAAISLGLCLLAGTMLLGCSESTRYRVLSFFFDGVPPPGGKRAGTPTEVGGGEPEGKLPVQKVLSSHLPYRERQCFQCHRQQEESKDGAFESSLCDNCHSDYFAVEPNDWVHGPVAAGQCRFCHIAHESKHLSLLKQPQPELCWRCHDAEAVLAGPYHAEAATRRCTSCHDPHAAGNRLLLADARTYRRRKGQPPLSVHAPWRDRQCSKCHAGKGAEMITGDPDATCGTCHQTLLAKAQAGKHHAPVRQGKCSLCHTPHDSPLPHLLRPAAETICHRCHRPEELRTATHPRADRADCFLCHEGHWSPRAHLLKPGIPD